MKPGRTMMAFETAKERIDRLDEFAESMGANRSEVMRQLIDAYASSNPIVRTLISEYAENLLLKPAEVVEVMLLDFAARVTAAEEVFGGVRDVNSPFLLDQAGRLVRGADLFEELRARYSAEYIQDTKEADRQTDQLRRDRAKLAAGKGKKRAKVTA